MDLHRLEGEAQGDLAPASATGQPVVQDLEGSYPVVAPIRSAMRGGDTLVIHGEDRVEEEVEEEVEKDDEEKGIEEFEKQRDNLKEDDKKDENVEGENQRLFAL